MTGFDKDYQAIVEILSKQRRRKFLLKASKGTLFLLGLFLLALCLAALLDIPFQFDESVRLGMAIGIAVVSAGIFLLQIVWPLIHFLSKTGPFSYEALAREVGKQSEKLHDELLNGLQIYQNMGKNREEYSLDLVAFSLRRILKKLRQLNFSHLYSLRRAKRAMQLFATPLLLSGAAFIIFPISFADGLNHILHPGMRFKPRAVEFLSVWPGDVTKVEGDSVEIIIKLEGAFTGPVELFLREKNRTAVETKEVDRDSSGSYRHKIEGLRSTTHYSVKAKDEFSPVYKIDVQKRPFVKNLKLQLFFPEYTKMQPRYQDDNVGDIIALKGTRVTVRASVNKPVKQAELVLSKNNSKAMKVVGNEIRSDFAVNEESSYRIKLEDLFGYENLSPIEYSIRPLPDQFPLVEIIIPGRDVDLNEELKLPVSVEAEDDFGFSRLRLAYRVETAVPIELGEDTTFQFIDLSANSNGDTKISADYLWDLADIRLLPEDIIYYFAEVWDNDRISGPKQSISKVYTARFPSIYEIYEEVANAQEGDLANLEEVLSDSKELKEKLDEIARELNQQKEMDWLKKQDLEELAESQGAMQQEIEEVRQNLQEMIERMEGNQMLSLETLQKYQELQQLFEEIMTPELQRALDKLRESFEQLDENKLKQAVSQMQTSQDKLLQNLERTINLLKQIQLEQDLDQAAKLAENLAERQEDLNQQLKEALDKDQANLLHQQQKLGDDAEILDELLGSLDQALEEQAQFQSETMDSLLQEMQKVMQDMDASQQQIQKGQMQQASKTGETTEQNLRDMLSQLQSMKDAFMQSKKQDYMKEFARTSEDLLRLSKNQEGLMDQTRGLSSSSPQLGQIAESQQQLLQQLGRATGDLYELSQKTFFVTPEIGRAMGKSIAGMQRALENLENRNTGVATSQQAQAMGGLNETILQIQKAMRALQGASSASGMDEFMKRLQQMSGSQQGINQETLMLGKQGQMSLEQQAAMARLAAEQSALRKSLQQLQQEFGNRSDILGRLDQVAEEMEDVVKDLQRRQVQPRTLDRQKRILSRLLDAQRSIREREYSRKRESRSGKTYFVRSPEDIDESIKQKKDRFLEDLIRARKAGYNEDYLELIREYFQALTDKRERQ